MPDLAQSLEQHFGYDRFLPGQQEVIGHLLAGQSAAAVFPTGGGKSLCYQLPALLLPGVTLVVSPLIALMKDQIDALARRGIAAARLDSTLTVDEYSQAMRDVRAGALRLLYVAPERFQNERFRQAIAQVRVSLFAIDEAHCISEWGHAFRPDYLKLVAFARQSKAERLLALTATATPRVLDDICRAFEITADCAIRNSCYRPNLTLLTTPVDAADQIPRLIARLRERPAGPTIVYVTLQKTSEELAEKLAAQGLPAKAYHAGLEDELRAEVQDWFMSSSDGIVVATIAFGMGIDKSDIRYVYHFNPPKSLENYAQEIGRAGRDGKPSTCEVFFCLDDLNQLENFAYGDTPTRDAVQRLVAALFAGARPGTEIDANLHDLSGRCDIRPLVVRTLLTYLELDGLLEGGTPFYATYKFQPLRTSAQILSEFEGERREFVASILRQAKKARTWFQIDLDQAARALDAPRDRVVRALDYLAERGWLNLEAKDVRHRYRRLAIPKDLAALAGELHARCVDRQRQEIARLAQVVALVDQTGCQVAALCAHFGETRKEPCGHCTRCLEPKSGREGHADHSAGLPVRAAPPIPKDVIARAMAVRDELPDVLSEPLVMARWLCGISSPVLTKSKLSSHELFGALGEQPFSKLLEELERAMKGSP